MPIYDIGPAGAASSRPARVELGGATYFVVRSPEGSPMLLSSVCPHLGGEILDAGSCFECPNHGWRFEHTGESVTSPGVRMRAVPLSAVDGRLIVELPGETRASPAKQPPPKVDLTIALHAHACLEFTYRGFSLLTDPWLDGPAFLGAWTQYPPPIVDIATLRPNALWISHEHSDHFHEPTLARFDRSTPVYFPDFPNRRIGDRLERLGFTHRVAMRFGIAAEIAPGITLTCYEPASLWNDAAVLIDVDGYRILNLNDAGLNRRIANAIGPVDVVASSFSPGASGHPLTWTHLNDGEKTAILERARGGALSLLKEAAAMYGAPAVLPFASHFALWHPSHEPYVRAMRKNTVEDVVRAFDGTDIRVIDLLPGDTFYVAGWRTTHDRAQWARPHDANGILAYTRAVFDAQLFAQHSPANDLLERSEVEQYLLRLNRTADIAFCEPLTATIHWTADGAASTTVAFEIADGELRLLESPPASPDLTIDTPAGILRSIITDNLSWDEAHIGYWCTFSRHPDVYHAGFWRLLQAPYFAKPPRLTRAEVRVDAIGAHTILADVIERLGEAADRIIRRYGLYCAGCHHSTSDTLAQGARQHGLDDHALERLLSELNDSATAAR